jgi:hypothetical protein
MAVFDDFLCKDNSFSGNERRKEGDLFAYLKNNSVLCSEEAEKCHLQNEKNVFDGRCHRHYHHERYCAGKV